MKHATRWQDWVNVLFGIWLFVSPWALGFAGTGAAAMNAYVLGAAVTVFAVIALFEPQIWEEWINLVLGFWLIISPFVLGFGSEQLAVWNQIILGVLVGGDALWAMQRSYPAGPRHAAG